MKPVCDPDTFVYRAARRDSTRKQNKHDRPMRKAIQREKPAFIRAQEQKNEAVRTVRGMRVRTQLRQLSRAHKKLAHRITRHIITEHDGEIQGTSLEVIYEKLAETLLRDASPASIELIKYAVEYGCDNELLEKKEAEAEDEGSSLIPHLAATA